VRKRERIRYHRKNDRGLVLPVSFPEAGEVKEATPKVKDLENMFPYQLSFFRFLNICLGNNAQSQPDFDRKLDALSLLHRDSVIDAMRHDLEIPTEI
jgi:hypothetical protein